MNADGRLHWSELKHIRESPAHFQHYRNTPFEPSREMRIGTAVDALVFGTTDRLAFYPGKQRRGAKWDEFATNHMDKEILFQSDLDVAEEIADRVRADPFVRNLMAEAAKQVRLDWERADIPCRGTADLLGMDLADLKVSTVSHDRMAFHARDLGWFGQLAWYRDNCDRAGLLKPREVYLIVASASPPHLVTPYRLTSLSLLAGQNEWQAAFATYRHCLKTNNWPGHTGTDASVDLDYPGALVETLI